MESLDNTFVEDSIQFNYPDLPPTSLYYNLAAAVDGTHCPITNVPHTVNGRHPWFSWKKRTNGVSYQVVLDCYNEKVINIDGPHKAAVNDLTIWKKSGVVDHLLPGQRVLGDAGYFYCDGVLANCPHSLLPPDPDLRDHFCKIGQFISGQRWKIESLFGRIKKFQALQCHWRHQPWRHGFVFRLACALWNSVLSKEQDLCMEWVEPDDDELENMDVFNYDDLWDMSDSDIDYDSASD
eukprot:TRINITY_DN65810_c1_g1_i1.p1 TRINITY_DN65810_c1_g1~~TRINITY_DN65810_c1_g1_i1.p1  ORF type:complete len:237 (+),score=17.65 TRINITY_DN65810_c1_g1_i1:211-921(+)